MTAFRLNLVRYMIGRGNGETGRAMRSDPVYRGCDQSWRTRGLSSDEVRWGGLKWDERTSIRLIRERNLN